MELWIRSQDREKLVKIEGSYINIPADFNSGGFGVYTNSSLTNCGFLRLGKYKTKERALEVLDEIHNHLEKLFWFNPQAEDDRRLNQLIKTYIYEMPKE